MAPALALLAGVCILPLTILVGISLQQSDPYRSYLPGFTVESYRRYLSDAWYVGQLGRTFRLAAISTGLCVALGYPLAYTLWRARGRRKTVLLAIVLLPLFTNIVARVYAWLIVFAKDGPIDWLLVKLHVLNEPALLNFRFGTAVLGVTYVALPYFVLIMFSALEGVDWSLVEAARTLGAKRLRSILEIVVPLSARGLAGALAVAITWGTGAFAEPRILGSPREWTIGNEAADQILEHNDWPFGAALSLILVASTMIVIVLTYRLVARKQAAT
jgi:ABC-type spermidine/putrescine transport system permease subunit I